MNNVRFGSITAFIAAQTLIPRRRPMTCLTWSRCSACVPNVPHSMTFIALWTGAFWGRPTWGTYWAWDARMTSELILLFLYLGVIALRNAIDDPRRADRACAVLALTGVVNIPIIYFSVHWWNTLHQGSSVSLTKAPAMAAIMLTGMLVMALAAWFYAIVATLARVRTIMLERERGTAWVGALREVRNA